MLFEMKRGTTSAFDVQCYEDDGTTAFDLTGYTVTGAFVSKDGSVSFQKVATVATPSNGLARFSFTRAEWTTAPIPAIDYDLEVWIDNGDDSDDDNIAMGSHVMRVVSVPQRVL